MKTYPNTPTPAQKKYFICLVEKAFPHSEQMRNFYYKLIPTFSKSEAGRQIERLATRIGRKK